ncbi:ABC transporter permease [[Clostridium] polysaccharolyticum]|uniref:NitT/TauT family transport system permease protein n=1 Tax=[Clostridium] polysaccharolyticum TaxID=29364 RepID=A0A1I0BY09_9FIRM|nr:ABC transporter permease subunit [[Clostridium] polysaccharolyticum]SET11281.1 NitT/TauT family transport system permease protein [[Clostridium] polysaccharolyticum]
MSNINKTKDRSIGFQFLVSFPTLLFLVNLFLTVFVRGTYQPKNRTIYILVLVLIWIGLLLATIRGKGKERSPYDICSAIYLFLLVWEIFARITLSWNQTLFPCIEDVCAVFITDWSDMLEGVFSSMKILLIGYGIALGFGNFLGLIVGYNERLSKDFIPISKVISSIPPIVYTPYLIALLPSFNSASISVMAFALFWPTFLGMITWVQNIESKILDSARTLNVGIFTMLFKIILPYTVPAIINSIRIRFSMSFMILIMAEMIGAQSGLGYYVKKFSDYIDFARVLAGIILIGLVITLANFLLGKLEKTAVKWEKV